MIIWYKLKKNAPASGINIFISNIPSPGLKIIITPIKPQATAIHVFVSIFSFKKTNAKTITIKGVKACMLWAEAKDKYLNDNIKKPDSNKDKMDLKICNFKLLVFQNFLLFFLTDSINDKNNRNKYLQSIIWNTVWNIVPYFWKTSKIEKRKKANIANIAPIFSWNLKN